MSNSFVREVKDGARGIAAIVGLALIAAVVGGYILIQQRFPVPGQDRYKVAALLSTTQGVTPGQGQKVTVSGVGVGYVTDVELEDGRAKLTMTIRKDDLPWVGRDAKVLLRPATALQDISVDMDPGTRAAGLADAGDHLIPVAQTRPNVNVDEILAGLDGDTRDYLKLLVNAGGEGLKGRSDQLRSFFKASTPVLAQTEQVTGTLARRRQAVSRLFHNLGQLSGALADHSPQLKQLVTAGNQTFSALSAEDASIQRSLQLLPGTLGSADSALRAVRPLAAEAPQALQALTPAVKALPKTLEQVGDVSAKARPVVANLSGLTRDALPLLSDLRPAAQQLRAAAPQLTQAAKVTEYALNELVHEPGGDQHSYLFWLAWFGHNAGSMLSTNDANGVWWRGQLIFSCSSVAQLPAVAPLLAPILGSDACPQAAGGAAAARSLTKAAGSR